MTSPALTMSPRDVRRLGVVMMSAVGDVVHALPVVSALRRTYPDASLTWVLQPGPAALVAGHPDVDDVVLFERGRGVRAFTDVRRALGERPPIDLLVNLQVYLKAGLVTALAPARVKLGFDRARARDMNWLFTNERIAPHPVQHVQDQYFEFLDHLGIAHDTPEWRLGPWPEERSWQDELRARFDRPLAAIVVATSKPEKDWLPERWADVIDALTVDYGLQPVLVGGTSPRERAAEAIIMQRASHPPVSLLGSGLRRLVGILDASSLVLSPDTGPLHISVALNRPVISLMGYTNPRRTGPYRRFHDLLVDAYGEPGEEYSPTMENRPGRMSRITVRDVLERVERWRSQYAGGAAR